MKLIGVGRLHIAQVCDMSCTTRGWFRLGSTFQVCNDRGEGEDESCAARRGRRRRGSAPCGFICICKGFGSIVVSVRRRRANHCMPLNEDIAYSPA